jgi:ABC-type transport system involved in multi-copper enzyme maturation permease subunit
MASRHPAGGGALAATLRVFELSLGHMLWSRRSIFLAVLVAGPVLLAVMIRLIVAIEPRALPRVNGAALGGPMLFGLMIWLIYIRFVVPVLGVFYGTSLIADEVEDKTITYLLTRPIPRPSVLWGKYLAYLACTLLLVLPSATIVYFLIVPLGRGSVGAEFPTLLADLGMLAAGLAAYGAVFAFIGARFKRPLVMGLVFALGWEPVILVFPGYLKRLTVAYYLQALVPHSMPAESAVSSLLQAFVEVPTLVSSLTGLALITLGALWFAGNTVDRREYVLDQ